MPLQILWLNLATDTTPALALALEPAAAGAMTRPPRVPGTPLLSGRLFRMALAISALITAATLIGYLAGSRGWVHDGVASTGAVARGRTYAFMTLAFAQLWLVGGARWPGRAREVPDDGAQPRASHARTTARRRWTRNPWAWAAVSLTTCLQIVICYLPPLANVLQIVPLALREWMLIAAFALAPVLITTGVLHLQRARETRRLRVDAGIIVVMVVLSAALNFVQTYRPGDVARRAASAVRLHCPRPPDSIHVSRGQS